MENISLLFAVLFLSCVATAKADEGKKQILVPTSLLINSCLPINAPIGFVGFASIFNLSSLTIGNLPGSNGQPSIAGVQLSSVDYQGSSAEGLIQMQNLPASVADRAIGANEAFLQGLVTISPAAQQDIKAHFGESACVSDVAVDMTRAGNLIVGNVYFTAVRFIS